MESSNQVLLWKCRVAPRLRFMKDESFTNKTSLTLKMQGLWGLVITLRGRRLLCTTKPRWYRHKERQLSKNAVGTESPAQLPPWRPLSGQLLQSGEPAHVDGHVWKDGKICFFRIETRERECTYVRIPRKTPRMWVLGNYRIFFSSSLFYYRTGATRIQWKGPPNIKKHKNW